MNTNSRRVALVAALPLFVAVACGDESDRSATPTSPAPTTAIATTAPVAPPRDTSAAVPGTTGATTTSTGPGATPTSTASPALPGVDLDVDVRLLAFRPEQVGIEAGQTIRWTQSDAGFHTITSGTVDQTGGIVMASPDGRFDSGQLATDATFELTLTEPGSYEYFCEIHPATMRGVVDVT